LVDAEARGMASHGLARVAQYAGHLRSGRVDGKAWPKPVLTSGAVVVDAADGLAFPACHFAAVTATSKARFAGIAMVVVRNSHHCGVLSYHLRPMAEAGQIGLAMTNSPAAIPAWEGKRPLFGTNPIAAIFPRNDAAPLVIDLSLSAVARGKLMVAAKEDKPIPLGWAVDSSGAPTTDAKQGLAGMMLAMGGVKGAALAMVVELLCTTLTGSRLGFEADSFFSDQGNRARIAQVFIAIDPASFSGAEVYAERLETLIAAMLADDAVRLPGTRGDKLFAQAQSDGIEISPELLDQLQQLAGS
jgi:(2R)-3-sulfolactate dehydrogenase (NADP+)